MQVKESINLQLLSDQVELFNAISSGDAQSKQTGADGNEEGTTAGGSGLLKTKAVQESTSLMLGGEQGTGGRPLKKGNPYLEIDLIDPTDPILFEGEIQKYKPGFKAQFINRWVQVTSKAFRYFVSKPGRDNPVIRPLLAIPICAIKSVNRVNYELPIQNKDKKSKEIARHQFELFLEEDFLDYFLSPMYEKHFSPDGKRINPAIQQLEKKEMKKNQASPNKRDVLNIKDKYIMEEENRLDEPLS